MRKLKHMLPALLLAAWMAAGMGSLPALWSAPAYADGDLIRVEYHTQEEIRSYFQSTGGITSTTPAYVTEPVLEAPYSPGQLTDAVLNRAIVSLNQVRYVAGIGPVALDETYCRECQIGSLVNAANHQMSHSPGKPAGMADAMFQQQACGKSNLGAGYGSLERAIFAGWMADEDSSNIDRVGHRRWVLNPAMGKTGFGYVNRFSSMYAFDESANTAYHGVTWPAANTPLELFENNYPWSISISGSQTQTRVTLTRQSDGKVWRFYKGCTDGYFNYNDVGYGGSPCIIFRPASITYQPGDSFKVEITGPTAVSYTVNFFQLAVTHTLSYNANGGSGAPAGQTGAGTVTLSGTKPTRNGYEFLGWSTSSSATAAQYQPGASMPLNANTTLYAVWRQKPTTTATQTGPPAQTTAAPPKATSAPAQATTGPTTQPNVPSTAPQTAATTSAPESSRPAVVTTTGTAGQPVASVRTDIPRTTVQSARQTAASTVASTVASSTENPASAPASTAELFRPPEAPAGTTGAVPPEETAADSETSAPRQKRTALIAAAGTSIAIVAAGVALVLRKQHR
ncbi:MAG: InlB B-repeat-containing protein [Clostridia bacterium]|nr:InlB B-repeat-containing protein [Clostridia bacterium]